MHFRIIAITVSPHRIKIFGIQYLISSRFPDRIFFVSVMGFVLITLTSFILPSEITSLKGQIQNSGQPLLIFITHYKDTPTFPFNSPAARY